MSPNSEICFCGLALGDFYQELALSLSQDLQRTAPGIPLIILTEQPNKFKSASNVIAIKHKHHFGYRPYNDKVFVLEEALKRFPTAIQIDVDTNIKDNIQDKIAQPWLPGITGVNENLSAHIRQNNPQDVSAVETVAKKLNTSLEQSQWVGESMFVVRQDEGKEKEFLKMWKKLARYWDIHKLGPKDGTLIGLAAASVGWHISSAYWQDLNSCLSHFDAHKRVGRNAYKDLKRAWGYRYRILQTKLSAWFDPDLLP